MDNDRRHRANSNDNVDGPRRSSHTSDHNSPGKRTLTESLPIQQRVTTTANRDPEVVRQAAPEGLAASSGALPFSNTIQRAFGHHDVSRTQAHTGPAATKATEAMGAEAYATGDHVVFGGAPSLHTAAHEAAHVVQQRGGVQLAGGVGAHDDSWEQHADRVADRVVQGGSAEALLDGVAPAASSASAGGGAVQAKFLNPFGDPLSDGKLRQLLDGFRKSSEYLALQRAHQLPKGVIEEVLAEIQTGTLHNVTVDTGSGLSSAYDSLGTAIRQIAPSKITQLLGQPLDENQDKSAAIGESNVELMRTVNQGRAAHTPLLTEPSSGIYYRDELSASLQKRYWDGYADPAFFQRISPFTFRVLPSVSAAAAITRFLEGFTVAECNSAVQATYYGTLLRSYGQQQFDEQFGSANKVTPDAQRLLIQRDISTKNPLDAKMTGTPGGLVGQAGTVGARPVEPGAWYYLGSSPIYKFRHPDGMWGGLNALYLGTLSEDKTQRFGGLGDSDKTEMQIYADLAAEFNKPPTAAELVQIFQNKLYEKHRGIFLPTLGNAASLSAVALPENAIAALGAASEGAAREILASSLNGASLVQPLRAADLGAPPPAAQAIQIADPWRTCTEDGTEAAGEAATHVAITLAQQTVANTLITTYCETYNIGHTTRARVKAAVKRIQANAIVGDAQKLAPNKKVIFPHPSSFLSQRETPAPTGFRGAGRMINADGL